MRMGDAPRKHLGTAKAMLPSAEVTSLLTLACRPTRNGVQSH